MVVISKLKALWASLSPFVQGMVVGALSVVVVGLWAAEARENRFEREIDAANRVAEQYQLAYNEAGAYWEERARQIISSSEELHEQLEARNAQLASDLAEAQATVQSLQEIRTTLRAKLDSSATSVVESDSTTFTVSLDEQVAFDGGGFVRVTGPITLEITEPSVATDLSVRGEFPLSIVVSRDPEGNLIVNAFTGDPRLAISQLDVTSRVEPPASRISTSGLAEQLTGRSPWINRLVGAGVCLALDNWVF